MSALVTLAGQVGITGGESVADADALGPRGRIAFAYLVCERHRPVPRDELAAAIWGEAPPASWETALRGLSSRLRAWMREAGLGDDWAVRSALGCLRLHLPADVVIDIEVARHELSAALRALAEGDHVRAHAAASAAVAVAAGEFLPGATGLWAEGCQAELRGVRLRALEAAAAAAAGLGRWTDSLASAEVAVALEPLRESAHRLVMAAQAGAGNRAGALRAYERCRALLADELGVPPSPETAAAYEALLRTDTPTPPPPDPEAPNSGPRPAPARGVARRRIPSPVTPLVGRHTEVAELTALVGSHRLVTLTGTGGVGKTRLALEVAAEMVDRFPDGVVLVDLAGVRPSDPIIAVIGSAFGLNPGDGGGPDEVISQLAPLRALVVVDNCEQVVGAAAEVVVDLLAAANDLRILATSRAHLGVAGEISYSVATLSLPEAGAGDLGRVSASGAGQLFLQRAQGARRGVGLTDHDAVAAATICRRLDGLPLALELAAARASTLSLHEIADRIDDRFSLLADPSGQRPARHQTLRATIDWSYDDLDPVPARLLRRLTVFDAPFTLDAAGWIAASDAASDDGDGGGDGVLDTLAHLVDRSLVTVEPMGPDDDRSAPSRYRLLESIRAYARDRARQSGGDDDARGRLLAWAVALAEHAEANLVGPEQQRWLEQLDADYPSVRAALEVDPGSDRSLRLAAAMGRFWETRGLLSEGRRALGLAVGAARERSHDSPPPPLVVARALNAAGLLAQRQGDYPAARSRIGEALAIWHGEGDEGGVAAALHGLGNVAALGGDLAEARSNFAESLAAGEERGDAALVAASLENLGWVAHAGADLRLADTYYRRALALRRELGDVGGEAAVLGHLADLAFQAGDLDRAFDQATAGLGLMTALGDRSGMARLLATLGHLGLARGQLEAGRAHLTASLEHHLEVGDGPGAAAALCNLADVDLLEGDWASARAQARRSLEVATRGRDRRGAAHALMHLARVELAETDPRAAAACYAQARSHREGHPTDGLTAEWIEGLAAVAAATGRAGRGARLWGAAARLRADLGAPVPPNEGAWAASTEASLRAALGEESFSAGWEAGSALTAEAAVAEAVTLLEEPGPRLSPLGP